MPWAGFEPARGCPRRILSPLCLPFHHQGILTRKYSTRREKKSNPGTEAGNPPAKREHLPMFKKKQRELTVDDAPDSLAPWEMLEEAEIAAQTARVAARCQGRALVAFARRLDTDAVACFDKGVDGTGKAVLVLEGLDAPELAAERLYPGFSAWFDDALAEHQNVS